MGVGKRKDGALISRTNPGRFLFWLLALLFVTQAEALEVLARLNLLAGEFRPPTINFDPRITDLLVPGKSIDRELSYDQKHSYPLELIPEKFLRLDFYSSNQNLLVSVSWPDLQKTMEWNVPRRVLTPVSWIADVHGIYLLEVRPSGAGRASSVYRLEMAGFRKASKQDQKQVTASRMLSEAEQLRQQWNKDSLQNAIRKYAAAFGVWQAIADRRQQAATLINIGDVWEILSEQQKALNYFIRAQKLYIELKDPNGKLATLNTIASSYVYIGENQRALEISNQAVALSTTINDNWENARALHNLGAAYYGMNDLQKAKEALNQALRLREELPDRSGQAETILYLGYIQHALKNTVEAEAYYQQSLNVWRELRNPRGEALVLVALGHISNILGDSQEALRYYNQSIEIFQTIGEIVGQGTALVGIAYLYTALGEKERALVFYLQALDIIRHANVVALEGQTLDFISGIYTDIGDYRTALTYSQQSVLANRKVSSPLGESYALANMGKIYEALGMKTEAMRNYRRALELSQQAGDRFLEGLLLNAVGRHFYNSGEITKALPYYRQALQLQEDSKDAIRRPSTLYNLARAERDLGNLEQAIHYAEQALDITESLRGKVASRDLRSSFVASVHQQYELTIDLLMQMHQQHPSEGYAARAFATSERARARSLLESLAETGTETRSTGSPALLERRGQLQELLNAKAEQQLYLPGNNSNETKDAALALELGNLTTQYEQVQGQIRSESPLYTSLAQLQPLSLKEVQEQVLDEQSLLLEFALGDDRSYLWAVTETGMTCHHLPKRTEIDQTARRIYELLIARQPKPKETATQYLARVKEAETQYWHQAAALSQLLLGPVADQLGTRRLLIVTEGALQYVPFGALPSPTGIGKGNTPRSLTNAAPLKGGISEQGQEVQGNNSPSPSPQPSPPVGGEGKNSAFLDDGIVPLIVEHEIINLPSASALAVLRQGIAKREAKVTKSIAVLADPVFEADDPRVSGHGVPTPSAKPTIVSHRKSTVAPLSDLQLSLRDVGMLQGGLGIPRLLSTRQEADAILAVSPAGACLKAVDFKASRETALSSELSQFRVVHFATHGLLNNQHPELSGLVLSLVDEQGKPQNGFLRLHDIYNLNLPADLVVLSACNTGLGKDIKGEGLVGIVRGFMYAGAARVVASLWKVDDEATAELMKRFYKQMLQENLSPSAALRVAQVELSQQKKWRSPYYWAGFVLQGEWK